MRGRALSRMVSRVTIHRATGRTTQSETTGLEVPVWDDVYAALPFRLDGGSSGDGGSRTITIAGTTYEQATGVGHLPHNTVDLADNDLIEITAGEWAGSVWRVVEAVRGDQKTARRVPIVEADRPGEWT